MIPTKLLNPLLFFALILIALQLGSGIWLFMEKFGLTPHEVYLYYAGDEKNFILPKSFEGILEIAVPHFVAVSVTLFVYAHFLLFTQIITEEKKSFLIISLFFAAIVNIFSPLGILYAGECFAWIKVVAFWSFEGLMSLLLLTLCLAVLRGGKA